MDEFFWATIAFIFLSAIVSAFIRARQRDDCLKLIDDHFITLVMKDGSTVWGDLRVFGRGLQLRYLAPHRTRRGLVKKGYLLYQKEMGEVLAACRFTGQLTPREAAERRQQIERTFDPKFWGRLKRGWRNTYNTLRDAFTRALGKVIGRVVQVSESKVLSEGQKDVEGVGKELLQAAGDAYEPMLEAHIGHPVVVELTPPGGGSDRVEIGGYLAEYTEHFIALFNVEHEAGEPFEVEVSIDDPAASMPAEVVAQIDEKDVRLVNRGHDFLIVRYLTRDDGPRQRLGAALPPGAEIRFARPDARFTVELRQVASVDLVCPRQHATVRYMGPRADAPDASDAVIPLHEDESVLFP